MVMDRNDITLLKRLLTKYKRYEKSLPIVFGLAYLQLQNGRKALTLLKSIKTTDPFLYGEALKLYGKTKEGYNLQRKEWVKLKAKLVKNPALLKKPDFLTKILSLADQFASEAEFERLVQSAKGILNQKTLTDIYLSHLLSKGRQTTVRFFVKRHKYLLAPWMKLNLALWENDTYLLQELVNQYSDVLPIRDCVESLVKIGEIKKAMGFAFKRMEENRDDYLAFKQFRDLVVENEDVANISVGYFYRQYYSALKEKFKIDQRLNNGFGFNFSTALTQPVSVDHTALTKAAAGKEILFGINKKNSRGRWEIGLGSLSKLKDNLSGYFNINWRPDHKTNIGFSFAKNKSCLDTIYLEVGGMKDVTQLSFSYQFNNRTSLYLSPEYDRFYAQDKTDLGKGVGVYFEGQYKLRMGYPDYTFRIFYQQMSYKSTHKIGVIREITPFNNIEVLPNSFLSLGAGFAFGYDNRDLLVRPWRPFLNVNLLYNTQTGPGFDFDVGIGGRFLRKDNLGLELHFNKNAGKTKETLFNIILNYKCFY